MESGERSTPYELADTLSWECPYERCMPRRKRCETLDDLCEHILSFKPSYYIQGHTRVGPYSRVYVEELVCTYCQKTIIPKGWSKRQKHLRDVEFCGGIPDIKEISTLRDIIKRKIISHTYTCEEFKGRFDTSRIKEGIARIERRQLDILQLLENALYGVGVGVKYQEALEAFEKRQRDT